MDEDIKKSLFENEKQAKETLKFSRMEIDKLDNDLINIISERTSYAEDIVKAKTYLDMDIYDEKREKSIHDKAKKLASQKGIDQDILFEILDDLALLSKRKQKHILDELE
ncbi:MAG: chorismate mutase [Methanobrevibacter boviskoreani]|jgi:chorismate mutase|uniref:chorismate mutase n=1 Tax=Methanobrevibacter TaxID=2172 RepID=UPI0003348285|nr:MULTISPECIES: chorismate mutase [Methanobrevibacter]AGN16443.1 chorismate mutase AroH [Methanobrevibacter sp. AbM4]MCI6774668.1 chorismate mutase [Methanobrevibacter boviskoreani]MDD6257414.1 chorismate mutase [Methanobrevibacter boviskoreani]MDY5615006.1 chorismate mutase [Methanobrevibacter boviskoreani]